MRCVVSAAETQVAELQLFYLSVHWLRRNYDTRALTDGFRSD